MVNQPAFRDYQRLCGERAEVDNAAVSRDLSSLLAMLSFQLFAIAVKHISSTYRNYCNFII